MANAQQVESIVQQALEHAPVAVKFLRWVDVGALIDFDEVDFTIFVEHEIKPEKLEERILKRMLFRLCKEKNN